MECQSVNLHQHATPQSPTSNKLKCHEHSVKACLRNRFLWCLCIITTAILLPLGNVLIARNITLDINCRQILLDHDSAIASASGIFTIIAAVRSASRIPSARGRASSERRAALGHLLQGRPNIKELLQ